VAVGVVVFMVHSWCTASGHWLERGNVGNVGEISVYAVSSVPSFFLRCIMQLTDSAHR